jgi:steroid 5-alpha reductase family enzyme
LAFGFEENSMSSLALALLTALYGIRLAAFLLYREFSVTRIYSETKQFDEKPLLQILPLATVLAVFYAFMVAPVLFALRRSFDDNTQNSVTESVIQYAGTILALVGLIMETVADQQKLLLKSRQKVGYGEKRFVSPTSGLYALCRHPNYSGEILFWTGILLGGCIADSMVGRVCGFLGWIGIVSIMIGSSRRLSNKQDKHYGGQKDYEDWKEKARYSLVPWPKKMRSTK